MSNRSCINLAGNTVSVQNLGTGTYLFKDKIGGNTLQFKSISSSGGTSISQSGDTIVISSESGGSASAAGSDCQIQFNSGGTFAASSEFNYNPNINALEGGSFSVACSQSIAFGSSAKACAACSAAFGNSTCITGENSLAFGFGSCTSGRNSVVGGCFSCSTGDDSLVIGYLNYTTTNGSILIGCNSCINGGFGGTSIGCCNEVDYLNSVAIGENLFVSGASSVALGSQNYVCSNFSFAAGLKTTVNGFVSTAFGECTTTNDYLETIFGRYNTIGTGNQTSWNSNDNLFIIGNGTGTGNTNNAFQILKNGNTAIDGNLTLTNEIQIGALTGSTVAGKIRWTGSDFEGYDGSSWLSLTASGGTGSPGGTDGQMQYNNGGSFGGADLIWDDSVNTFVACKNGMSSTISAISDTLFHIPIDWYGTDGYVEFARFTDAATGTERGKIYGNSDSLRMDLNALTFKQNNYDYINFEDSNGCLTGIMDFANVHSSPRKLDVGNNAHALYCLDTVQIYSDLKLGSDTGGFTFPNSDGNSGQTLITDGSGNVAWCAVSGASTTSAGGTDGQLQYNNGGSFSGTSLVWDDSVNTFGWGIAAQTNVLLNYQSSISYNDATQLTLFDYLESGGNSILKAYMDDSDYYTTYIESNLDINLNSGRDIFIETSNLSDIHISPNNGNIGFFGVTPVGQPSSLTAANSSTVDSTYGTEERDVIQNLRTRVNELETKLQNLGLLA